MNNDLQSSPAILKIVVLFTCFLLVLLYNKSKGAGYNPLVFKRTNVFFKQHPEKNEISISTNANSGKTLDLYFYSVRKKITEKISINSGQKTIVKAFKSGTYLYECFDNELKIKSGKLELQ